MATVRFLAEARIDAQVAWAFYARQSAQAAQRFEDQLERAQERLTRQPEMYGRILDECRACPIHQTNHHLIYSVEGDEVLVVAVVHNRQSQSSWRHRV